MSDTAFHSMTLPKEASFYIDSYEDEDRLGIDYGFCFDEHDIAPYSFKMPFRYALDKQDKVESYLHDFTCFREALEKAADKLRSRPSVEEGDAIVRDFFLTHVAG